MLAQNVEKENEARQMNIDPQRAAPRPEAAPSPPAALPSVWTAEPDPPWRAALLERFDAIDLSEMDDVALLHRTDTKFLLAEEQVFQALARLTDHYRILETNGQRLQRYRTLYFDTPTLALYRQHHDGKRNRYKVRKRAYADSNLAFLEIKRKIDAQTTIKNRMPTRELSVEFAPDTVPFLRTHYPYHVEELEPKLLNTFQRLTLVGTHTLERLTVDVGLISLWNGAGVSLAGIAIAEVKQERYAMDSEFVQQMRALGVRATGLSKYCIGVSMLYPQVKHNRFNPQLRQIAKLLHQGEAACQTNSLP
jgi:hypothetical protein